jgi:ACR3 family arsenite efflux pump ArsB
MSNLFGINGSDITQKEMKSNPRFLLVSICQHIIYNPLMLAVCSEMVSLSHLEYMTGNKVYPPKS